MTSGTNWSNANLISITPDDRAAAKELDVTEETLEAGQARSGSLARCAVATENVHVQELVAVVAAKVLGEKDGKTTLEKDTIVLTDRVTAGEDVQGEPVWCLEWRAPEDGTYKLFAFWLHGTGQIARPSCAISYTINYIDR